MMLKKINKTDILDGQIGFFDIQEVIQPKPVTIRNVNFENIIEKYSKSCTRIVQMENMLLVELNDRTLVFNQYGDNESVLDINVMLRPKDKIIVANIDKSITEEQIKTLRKVKTEEYIKRKSDNNIIIPYENFSVVIYPTGHLSKWMHKAIYKENEIFNINQFPKIQQQNKEIEVKDEVIRLGDTVSFEYYGTVYTGTVVSLYNNNESVNVRFNKGRTSFYYKNLKKVN